MYIDTTYQTFVPTRSIAKPLEYEHNLNDFELDWTKPNVKIHYVIRPMLFCFMN